MHHPYKYSSTVTIVTIVTISATTNAVPTAVIIPMPESLPLLNLGQVSQTWKNYVECCERDIYKNDVYVNIQDQSLID